MFFDIAYPERLSRLSTFFRLPLLIPVLILASLFSYFVQVGMLIGFTTVFWRRKYSQWLFRGLSGAYGWSARGYAYAYLHTDRFPSFSPEQSTVTLEYS